MSSVHVLAVDNSINYVLYCIVCVNNVLIAFTNSIDYALYSMCE